MKTIGRLITALVLFSVPAFSQDRDVTIFAGVQSPGKLTLSNAPSTGTTGATQILSDPINAGTFGLRIGHGNVWGGEHTFAYNPNFLDSNSKAIVLSSNFRIQAPLPVVKPYATAGLGTIISWGSGVSDIGSKFAINYGGGIKVMPAGPVGINIGVRGYTVPRVQSQTLNIVEASVGVVFGF
jgi:hypothetical protein